MYDGYILGCEKNYNEPSQVDRLYAKHDRNFVQTLKKILVLY